MNSGSPRFETIGLEDAGRAISHNDRAIQALWAAVLRLAVEDAKRPEGRYQKENSVRNTARRWIADSIDRVGSFVWICDLIGISPQRVRTRLDIHPLAS